MNPAPAQLGVLCISPGSKPVVQGSAEADAKLLDIIGTRGSLALGFFTALLR